MKFFCSINMAVMASGSKTTVPEIHGWNMNEISFSVRISHTFKSWGIPIFLSLLMRKPIFTVLVDFRLILVRLLISQMIQKQTQIHLIYSPVYLGVSNGNKILFWTIASLKYGYCAILILPSHVKWQLLGFWNSNYITVAIWQLSSFTGLKPDDFTCLGKTSWWAERKETGICPFQYHFINKHVFWRCDDTFTFFFFWFCWCMSSKDSARKRF